MKIKVSSPGKVHLLGEHTIIYSKPALMAAINKRCFVTISKRQDSVIRISLNGEEHMYKTTVNLLDNIYTQERNKMLSNLAVYKHGKNDNNPFSYPLICIAEAYHFYHPSTRFGFDMDIQSEIPIGRGMGSSAALAIAISAGLTIFFNAPWDLNSINSLGFASEQSIHGTPSGGDNTICCFGGFLYYQNLLGKKIQQSFTPWNTEKMNEYFFLIDSGVPTESTGQMVQMVRDRYMSSREEKNKLDTIFNNQSELVLHLRDALVSGDLKLIADSIQKGERNLELMGVVSNTTKALIQTLEHVGFNCKISGAGGKITNSGLLLCFGNKRPSIEEPIIGITFGQEGVAIE